MHIWNFTDNKQADSFTAQLPFRLFVTIRISGIKKFPEVYHAQEINEAVFAAPANLVRERGVNTTYRREHR